MTISAWGSREFVLISTLFLAVAVTMRSPPELWGGSPPTAAASDKPASPGFDESHGKNSSQQLQAAADSPQSKPAERVIWLQFLGESDRSVPIALISDSDQAIDHFLAAQPKDSVARYGSRVLASSAEFGCITKTLEASGVARRKTGLRTSAPFFSFPLGRRQGNVPPACRRRPRWSSSARPRNACKKRSITSRPAF